ncbi:MAG TPA: DJ-1/PfpI family protein [Thermomicrobiales bacterium]|jgi:transcriptional regulator GlxA family with amidase domain|nr:DJ-1/PfpI family protein [Thermomicrobiales bacterium]
MDGTRTVGILLFDDVEVLDAFGPYEVFNVARTGGPDDGETKLFHVVTIAESSAPVRARGDLIVQPHFTIDDHPPLDILVVPGGFGTRAAVHNTTLLDWLREQTERVDLRTSVCTGAFLYAEIGLLDGRSATTHWGSIERMRDSYPSIDVQEEVRFVEHDTVITSAGISAGIDMALHVVARLHGLDAARTTARYMEYDWRPKTESL